MITRNTATHSRLAKRKKGFTLTEIAIVLGIIGLILGAIWAAASSVYANLKSNQAQQGILAAAQAVRSMFATSANTGTAASTPITSPGMFPQNWVSAASAGKTGNPWHVNPTANFAFVIGNGSQFAIELDGIADIGCSTIVSFYNSSASSAAGGQVPGLVGSTVSVATTTETGGAAQIGTTTGTATAPVFATGPSSCSGGKLLDNVAITFDMSIM
jgi:prepilin-type N-terminal cleavage/methylation domain-containing protein